MKRLTAIVMLVVLLVTGYVIPAAAGEWICAACSTANDSKFCTECGKAKPTPSPTPVPKKCQGCGFDPGADSTYKFCPQCGLEFGKAPATPTPKPTATPSPTPKKTPTPTPRKTPTPTPKRVFEVTGVTRQNNEGTVTVKWTDSADRGPYKVTYRQLVSDDFNSSRQKKIWYYTATESTYLTSCVIDYMEPSVNYWITVTDRDGKEIRYAYRPDKFLTFDSFDIGIQGYLKQRKNGDGTKISYFSKTDFERMPLYDWGMYVKFTFPKRGATKDYVLHVAVYDPNGIQHTVIRDDTLTLEKGWTYYYWNFLNFSSAFDNAEKYGEIVTGEWRADFYLNNKYVGCYKFRVRD